MGVSFSGVLFWTEGSCLARSSDFGVVGAGSGVGKGSSSDDIRRVAGSSGILFGSMYLFRIWEWALVMLLSLDQFSILKSCSSSWGSASQLLCRCLEV